VIPFSPILTWLVLLAVIAALIVRPGGLSEAVAAAVGAAVVLMLGTATPVDVIRGIQETLDVLLFLVAMMIVALVAEEVGVFDWAANRAIRLSAGDGRLLFINLYLLGAVITIFLSLDVTAVMLAPLICALVRRARLSPLPYVVACAFVANTASLLLPVSNLTNLLVYGLLNLPFWSFVRLLFWPELAAVVVNVLVFLVLFRRMIPLRFAVSEEWHASTGDPVGLVIAGGGLVGVVVALMVFGLLGLPLYIPAAAGAVIMGLVALRRQDIELSDLRHGVAWSLPLFVVGMYTVVLAANRSGLDLLVGRPLLHLLDGSPSPGGLLLLSFAAALGSNLLNNIPMALVVITSLMTAPAHHRETAALAALIGTNVGANGTTFGSLATLLVLRAARRAGFQIDLREFLRISALTTPLMVLAAALCLWLALR